MNNSLSFMASVSFRQITLFLCVVKKKRKNKTIFSPHQGKRVAFANSRNFLRVNAWWIKVNRFEMKIIVCERKTRVLFCLQDFFSLSISTRILACSSKCCFWYFLLVGILWASRWEVSINYAKIMVAQLFAIHYTTKITQKLQ